MSNGELPNEKRRGFNITPSSFVHGADAAARQKLSIASIRGLPKISSGTREKGCFSLLVEFLEQFQDLMFSQGKGVTSKVDHILGGLKGDPG